MNIFMMLSTYSLEIDDGCSKFYINGNIIVINPNNTALHYLKVYDNFMANPDMVYSKSDDLNYLTNGSITENRAL